MTHLSYSVTYWEYNLAQLMVAGKETSLDLFIIVPGTPNKIWDLSVHVYYSNNLF
jgi:hypothetical protein